MLEINAISKIYSGIKGDKQALSEVSFQLRPGEIVGLFGENGAGKSTLMKCILGYTEPALGASILLDGEKVKLSDKERFAFATGEHSFFASMTPKEHREFYREQFPRFDKERYAMLMDFFGLPEKERLRGFSTGQKNQFEVIMALSQGADYIFMDEPFAGNDIFNREDFYKVMLGILKPNECLVLSTHLIEEVRNIISRALFLKRGRLIEDCVISELEEEGIDLIDHMKELYSYDRRQALKASEGR